MATLDIAMLHLKNVTTGVPCSVSHIYTRVLLSTTRCVLDNFRPAESQLQQRHISQHTWKQSVFLFQTVALLVFLSMFGLAGAVPAPQG